jgi:RHS repeat-associated protein
MAYITYDKLDWYSGEVVADNNGDCYISTQDMAIYASSLGKSIGHPDYDPQADLNSNGTVNTLDLTWFSNNLQTYCPHYIYDYQGNLVRIDANGPSGHYGTRSRTYIGGVFENPDVGGVTRYYEFAGRRIAMRQSGGVVNYFASDHLGGVGAMFDSQGGFQNRIRYQPFGQQWTGTVGTDKRFTGYDQETKISGLYYAGARFYSADLGRFLSADPIQVPGANPYAYAANNPLRYTDPTGMYPVDGAGEWLVPRSDYVPPAYISRGVAYLTAYLDLLRAWDDGGPLSSLAQPIADISSFLPGLGEAEDGANVFGCSWVEARCGLPQWRKFLGAGSLFAPFLTGGTIARRADDAASLLRINKERGLLAERILGTPAIKQALELGGGRSIIPDLFDRKLGAIAEVKNVRYLSNTSQLRTYSQFAETQGWVFAIVVRQDTRLSTNLQAAIAASNGRIQLFRISNLP